MRAYAALLDDQVQHDRPGVAAPDVDLRAIPVVARAPAAETARRRGRSRGGGRRPCHRPAGGEAARRASHCSSRAARDGRTRAVGPGSPRWPAGRGPSPTRAGRGRPGRPRTTRAPRSTDCGCTKVLWHKWAIPIGNFHIQGLTADGPAGRGTRTRTDARVGPIVQDQRPGGPAGRSPGSCRCPLLPPPRAGRPPSHDRALLGGEPVGGPPRDGVSGPVSHRPPHPRPRGRGRRTPRPRWRAGPGAPRRASSATSCAIMRDRRASLGDTRGGGPTPVSWTPTIAAASAGRSPRWGGSTPTRRS